MKRNAVSFAVENDGSKAVRADLVSGLKNFAAVGLDGRDGLVQASLAIEVEQHAFSRRRIRVAFHRREASGGVALLAMGQDGKPETGEFLLLRWRPEDGPVKANRPVQILDRHVEPDDLIGHRSVSKKIAA
jgi:hypothetical protein